MKRLRKDAGHVSIDDLLSYPSWEFCLDEEGADGQSESTVRPFKSFSDQLKASDSCLVSVTFTSSGGRSFVGWLSLGSGQLSSLWHLKPEIFISDVPAELIDDPRFHQMPSIIAKLPARISIGFSLPNPRHCPPETLRPVLDFAYKVIGIQPTELFPLKIQPNQTVIDWPANVSMDGFICQPGRTNEPFMR